MSKIQRLGELHIVKAREKALRIFAFSSAVFPGEWKDRYIEDITLDLLEFAFHARRVNEICGIDVSSLDSIRASNFVISDGNPGDWVERYDYALNRLLHATEFVFGNAHSLHRVVFTSSESNLVPSYVQVTTDQRSRETIGLFGLAFCFLNAVIPEVKRLFPKWVF